MEHLTTDELKRLNRSIRKVWLMSFERYQFIKSRKLKDVKEKWLCENCGTAFVNRKDVQVDHKIPVGGPKSYGYLHRMFPGISGYSLLCTKCHKEKTKLDLVVIKNRGKNDV